MKLALFLLAALVAVQTKIYNETHKTIVQQVNESNTTWKAGFNKRFENMNHEQISKMMGARQQTEDKKLEYINHEILADFPENFDSRVQWPTCESIKEIRDQSNCGSCWAFSCSEAFSDRICIASGGTDQTKISSQDVLTCCHKCGDGCDGGWENVGWQSFVRTGVVTGNLYGDNNYCQSYTLQPCDHHVSGKYIPCTKLPQYKTPACERQCNTQYQGPSYQQDKHYAASAYQIRKNQDQIKQDIQTYGPVSASFTVYEDFLSYKSGVYQHRTGSNHGGHAIKIIGWGVEAGTPYWLVSNSWNNDWGMDGLFKILRGSNECGIEGGVSAGRAKTSSQTTIEN